jgi:hypothetical protein
MFINLFAQTCGFHLGIPNNYNQYCFSVGMIYALRAILPLWDPGINLPASCKHGGHALAVVIRYLQVFKVAPPTEHSSRERSHVVMWEIFPEA